MHHPFPLRYLCVVYLRIPLRLATIAHKVAQDGNKFLVVQLSGLSWKFSPEGCPTRLFHLPLTADLSWYAAPSEVIHQDYPTVHFQVIYSPFYTRCWHLCRISPLTTDIDECLSVHACQHNQRCVNTVGSYVCQRLISCPPGYQINNDICEGTAHFIGIKSRSHRVGKCAVNTSIVNTRAHNGRKAHCWAPQSCLPPWRAGRTNLITSLRYSSLLWVCNVSFDAESRGNNQEFHTRELLTCCCSSLLEFGCPILRCNRKPNTGHCVLAN